MKEIASYQKAVKLSVKGYIGTDIILFLFHGKDQ